MAASRATLWSTDVVPAAIGRQVKISERVASAIVDLIIEQGLKPGDRLPNEAEMIDQFAVGRGSLREALRILETYGLISLRSGPGGGPVLLHVNPRDVSRSFSLYLSLGGATLRELSEARLLIDPLAARLAAEALTDDSADTIRAALDHERASMSGDPNVLVQRANDFHYVLANVTGNTVINLVATALKEMYTSRLVGAGIAGRTTDSSIHQEHQDIAEAVLEGDGDRAEQLMREHSIARAKNIAKAAPAFLDSTVEWG
jgi:GntR family transcriptional regulator, transcriptional repressor for pyruvate dehydrogenase complex